MHDPVTIMAALRPDLMQTQAATLTVETKGERVGEITADYGEWRECGCGCGGGERGDACVYAGVTGWLERVQTAPAEKIIDLRWRS